MIRFVVYVDIEANDLSEAYAKLYETMSKVDTIDFQWESADEAYDQEGLEVNHEELQSVVDSFFAQQQKEK